MSPSDTEQSASDPVDAIGRGAFWMIGSAAAFAVMSALVKAVGARIPSQEVVLARAVVSLVLSYALLRRAGIPMLGRRRGLLLLRGLFGFLGLSCVFAAVTRMPLAEATVLQYMHPTFTALLAWLVLGERADARVLAASGLGLIGVAFVAQPGWLLALLDIGASTGGAPLDPIAVALGLGGAFFSACAYVTVRRLSVAEHPLVIVLYFPLVTVPATLPLVAFDLVWPTPIEWAGLVGVGVAAQAGQVWLTRGLSRLPASRGTALSYIQVVFAAMIGVLVFAEPIRVTTVIGGLLVIGSTLAMAMRRLR